MNLLICEHLAATELTPPKCATVCRLAAAASDAADAGASRLRTLRLVVSGPFYGEGARGPCRFVAALSLSSSRLASIVAFGSSVGYRGTRRGLDQHPSEIT